MARRLPAAFPRKLTAMFFLALLLFSHLPASCKDFQQALPGYKFSFPADHRSHEDYKTEWWYYTGHLHTTDKRNFGYELTFFRTGRDTENVAKPSPWKLENIYLAHFAVSDENNKKFHFYEKLNRQSLNVAGARDDIYYVSNEGWIAEEIDGKMYLKADTPELSIHLLLESDKPPVVHGKDGVSQKADCKGCASHYYSMTRLKTEGLLFEGKKPVAVTGETWMDHEFGSNQLTSKQVGWDWYSLQLDNNMEIMLYVMRKSDGTYDSNSSGTIVYADGHSEHITLSDYSIKSSKTWTSPLTKGVYPMQWHVTIPKIKADLSINPSFPSQELVTTRSTGVTYWEGSSSVAGSVGGKKVSGDSYVEMTGYAEHFKKNI
jgi:predicted secreted hydrolase